MEPRVVRISVASLLILTVSAFAVDPAFKLVKEDEKVNVYSRGGKDCTESGADVLFVVENKTKERLELKMELLNMRIKNRLTVVVEPASNTSVLSMSPEATLCGVELVDMKVNSLTPPVVKEKTPVTASTEAEPKI
ncbi:MAG TPA: hypothetical protein VK465_14085 [Fibrobacteria bacterium]|nr:hypothetical protein [Fibrobacteria bacterium]